MAQHWGQSAGAAAGVMKLWTQQKNMTTHIFIGSLFFFRKQLYNCGSINFITHLFEQKWNSEQWLICLYTVYYTNIGIVLP